MYDFISETALLNSELVAQSEAYALSINTSLAFKNKPNAIAPSSILVVLSIFNSILFLLKAYCFMIILIIIYHIYFYKKHEY